MIRTILASLSVGFQSTHDQDKAKPAVKRGRKTTGLMGAKCHRPRSEKAELPWMVTWLFLAKGNDMKAKASMFLLVSIFLSLTVGMPSAHSVLMTITEGTYTPSGGDPISVTGTIDVAYPEWWAEGQNSFTFFTGIRTEIFLDNYAPFSFYWEVSSSGNPLPMDYGGHVDASSHEDYPGFGSGYLFYTGYHDPDYHLRVFIESFDAVEFSISFDDFPGIGPSSYTLSAVAAPVPEPATIILLGTGLLGLVGASRKMFIRT